MTGGACAVIAGLTPIVVLSELVSIGTLAAFTLVSIGVLVLRRRLPDAPRPFRVPFAPWIPAAAAVVSVLLMVGLPRATWERLLIWLAVGLVIHGTRVLRRRARS